MGRNAIRGIQQESGENDYNDDINARSLMTNYLSGGSVFNPTEKGLKVPFELTFAMHSDAGFKTDDALVGSLGIYTTNFNDGKVNSGISRYASRDLTDMVLTGLQKISVHALAYSGHDAACGAGTIAKLACRLYLR